MSQIFFAKSEKGEVGSFLYSLGLIEFTMSDDALAIVNNLSATRADKRDPVVLAQLAYEVTSLFHETRHFVDCFGTIAGLSLFAQRLKIMKSFALLCESVRTVHGGWPSPPVTWADQPEAQQQVRDFVRWAKAFTQAEDLFVAPFEPIEIDGFREEFHLEIDYEGGGKVDASPIRVARIGADAQGKQRSVIYPLGFEALLEGSAHAISRSMVEQYFPQPVADAFERRTMQVASMDARGDTSQRAAQASTPYMVVDLLITRFLRQNGIDTFPRNLVLAAIDRVLATSFIGFSDPAPGQTVANVARVGGGLVSLMRKTDPKILATGELPPNPKIDAAYSELIAAFEAQGRWETVVDDQSPLASIHIWESYMAHEYVVPLLRARVETQGRAFSTDDGFMSLVQQIGLLPARVINGSLTLSHMPPRVQQAWWHCLMVQDVMWQVARSPGPVLCPRAYDTVPGIGSKNLALTGNCNTHRIAGCGTHQQVGGSAYKPACLFEDTLRVCGLAH